jgi:hypothetical protein
MDLISQGIKIKIYKIEKVQIISIVMLIIKEEVIN